MRENDFEGCGDLVTDTREKISIKEYLNS